jgi:hypothetical protein
VEKFCAHIEKLLAHHDFVVVPNLGGFVVQIQSAQILTDRITPPLATIGFNPLMHHADGLLAIEISRTERISYRLAMEYIVNEVAAIQFRLNAKGIARLGNLGSIMKDEAGNLQFQPLENASYLPQNYGFSDIYIQTRKSITDKESGKITIQFKTSGYYKYAAAILLLTGLFMFSNPVSDVRQADYADLTSFSFLEMPVLSADTILPAPADTVDFTDINTSVEDTLAYHVIVASLGDKITADKFCNSLIESDFANARVLPPVRTYRIAIESFSNREQAIQFMENLRKTDSRFETAWVLCN